MVQKIYFFLVLSLDAYFSFCMHLVTTCGFVSQYPVWKQQKSFQNKIACAVMGQDLVNTTAIFSQLNEEWFRIDNI